MIKFPGYRLHPTGLWAKVQEYPQGASKRIEVLLRDGQGRLVRVLRGKAAGRFQHSYNI